VAGAWGWQPYHLHVPILLKSDNLILLEPSGPVQACNGFAVPLYFKVYRIRLTESGICWTIELPAVKGTVPSTVQGIARSGELFIHTFRMENYASLWEILIVFECKWIWFLLKILIVSFQYIDTRKQRIIYRYWRIFEIG